MRPLLLPRQFRQLRPIRERSSRHSEPLIFGRARLQWRLRQLRRRARKASDTYDVATLRRDLVSDLSTSWFVADQPTLQRLERSVGPGVGGVRRPETATSASPMPLCSCAIASLPPSKKVRRRTGSAALVRDYRPQGWPLFRIFESQLRPIVFSRPRGIQD